MSEVSLFWQLEIDFFKFAILRRFKAFYWLAGTFV